VTSKAIVQQLATMKKDKQITVRVNSKGGSVFEATAIHNAFRNHPAKIVMVVDTALSAASYIVMAGDEIRAEPNAVLMIHEPRGVLEKATADEMRKGADLLDKVKNMMITVYASRSRQKVVDIARMMSEETWLTADEAKHFGFVDSVIQMAPDPVPVATTKKPYRRKNVDSKGRPLDMWRVTSISRPRVTSVEERESMASVRDPIFAWNELLKAKIDCGMTKVQAVKDLVKRYPDLHKDYLAAYNAKFGRKDR
jgi:ATP-dependent protease ClpP protease subunit